LRATIDWSYQLLSSDEQTFFRRMGVFVGGFTLHAARTFCEIDDLELSGEDGIASLVSKSLLGRVPQADGVSRYRFPWGGGLSTMFRHEAQAEDVSR
jgi:predicted ATPase